MKTPIPKYLAVGFLGTLLVLVILLVTCSESIVNQVAFQPEKGSRVEIDRLPPSIRHYYFETADGEKLSSFYFLNSIADKTILYFHGNAGNASQRFSWAMDLVKLNSNVLLIDYRGYGLSSGSASEAGIYLDGRAALDFLINDLKVDSSSIFVYGRSLGSVVAVELASHFDFRGMILITPLSSGADLARMIGMGFATSLLYDPFDNLTKIGTFRGPILIIHGDKDQVLPVEMGRELKVACLSPVRYVEIPGAGHNNISNINGRTFYGQIEEFCTQVLDGRFEG